MLWRNVYARLCFYADYADLSKCSNEHTHMDSKRAYDTHLSVKLCLGSGIIRTRTIRPIYKTNCSKNFTFSASRAFHLVISENCIASTQLLSSATQQVSLLVISFCVYGRRKKNVSFLFFCLGKFTANF